jgi:hypothetical protein
VLVMLLLREDFANMAPFNVFIVVDIAPWLEDIFPPPKCQLLQVPKDV